MSVEQAAWKPSASRIADANLTRFIEFCRYRGCKASDYDGLWQWSVDDPPAFWESLAEFADVVGERGPGATLENPTAMPGARWFTGVRLNYAENLLRHAGREPAVVFVNERGSRRSLSGIELREAVARFADGLRSSGVAPGDRVAGFLPNLPEAVMAMLGGGSQ